jgi:hypothetical protein
MPVVSPPTLTVIPWSTFETFFRQFLLNCSTVYPIILYGLAFAALGPQLYHSVYDAPGRVAPEHLAPVDPGEAPAMVNGAGAAQSDRLYERWTGLRDTYLSYMAAITALRANLIAMIPPTIEQAIGQQFTGLANVPMPTIIAEVKRLYHQSASARVIANNKTIMARPYDPQAESFVSFIAEKKEAFKFALQNNDAQTEQSKIAYFEGSIRQVGVTMFDNAIQQFQAAVAGGLVPTFDDFATRMMEAEKFFTTRPPGTVAFGNGVANAATTTSLVAEMALLRATVANMAAAMEGAPPNRKAAADNPTFTGKCKQCGTQYHPHNQRLVDIERCKPCYVKMKGEKAKAIEQAKVQGQKDK